MTLDRKGSRRHSVGGGAGGGGGGGDAGDCCGGGDDDGGGDGVAVEGFYLSDGGQGMDFAAAMRIRVGEGNRDWPLTQVRGGG